MAFIFFGDNRYAESASSIWYRLNKSFFYNYIDLTAKMTLAENNPTRIDIQ